MLRLVRATNFPFRMGNRFSMNRRLFSVNHEKSIADSNHLVHMGKFRSIYSNGELAKLLQTRPPNLLISREFHELITDKLNNEDFFHQKLSPSEFYGKMIFVMGNLDKKILSPMDSSLDPKVLELQIVLETGKYITFVADVLEGKEYGNNVKEHCDKIYTEFMSKYMFSLINKTPDIV